MADRYGKYLNCLSLANHVTNHLRLLNAKMLLNISSSFLFSEITSNCATLLRYTRIKVACIYLEISEESPSLSVDQQARFRLWNKTYHVTSENVLNYRSTSKNTHNRNMAVMTGIVVAVDYIVKLCF